MERSSTKNSTKPSRPASLASRCPWWEQIPIAPDEEFISFFTKLLDGGRTAWYQRTVNPLKPPHSRFAPLSGRQTWKAWRQVLTHALQRFWEECRHVPPRKPRPNSMRARCEQLMEQVLAPYTETDNGWTELVTQMRDKGKPITSHFVATLMSDNDETLSIEVCAKYVKQRFLLERSMFTPHALTTAQLAQLKRQDPSMYDIAVTLRSFPPRAR